MTINQLLRLILKFEADKSASFFRHILSCQCILLSRNLKDHKLWMQFQLFFLGGGSYKLCAWNTKKMSVTFAFLIWMFLFFFKHDIILQKLNSSSEFLDYFYYYLIIWIKIETWCIIWTSSQQWIVWLFSLQKYK